MFCEQCQPLATEQPQFLPGEITIFLAAVSGFPGLMDAYRALDGLAMTDSVSVVDFKNDEASFREVLRQPVSARQMAEGLQAATGLQVLIEESHPDARRLRLRFIGRLPGDSGG